MEIHKLIQQVLKFQASFIDSLGKKIISISLFTKLYTFFFSRITKMHPSLQKLMLPPLIS